MIRYLIVLLLVVPAFAQRTVRPRMQAGDRWQGGATNWLYTADNNGRIELRLGWNGGSQLIIQLRRDVAPNSVEYLGDNSGATPTDAVYVLMRSSVDGNNDARFRARMGLNDTDYVHDIKERGMVLESSVLAKVFWWYRTDDGSKYQFASNNLPTQVEGTLITALSNFTAAAALAITPVTIAVAADNQVVSTTNRSFIKLTSDAVSTSRTIILTPSNLPGAILKIMFSGANGAEMLDDQAQTGGGTTRTSGTLTFTDHDVVTFVFEGTDWRQATAMQPN